MTLVLAMYGWRIARKRGVLLALLGPLFYAAWRAHVYATRFDPQTGYFGLDKVSVLVTEIVLVLVLGTVLGRVWNAVLNGANTAEKQSE
jgi:hypothetical protein